MPSNGQHSFLPKEIGKLVIEDNVSMPSNGQHSFLLEFVQNKTPEICMCQCPQTGHTLFYVDEANAIMAAAKACVNALKRATLISTLQNFTVRMEDGRCQCPPTGHTHFYGMGRRPVSGKQAVSMPSNGQHSFLQTWILTYLNYLNGVNALKRATLIST